MPLPPPFRPDAGPRPPLVPPNVVARGKLVVENVGDDPVTVQLGGLGRDFAVHDESGRQVFLWSAGRPIPRGIFRHTFQPHDADSWAGEFVVPVPFGGGEATYTVEGWLNVLDGALSGEPADVRAKATLKLVGPGFGPGPLVGSAKTDKDAYYENHMPVIGPAPRRGGNLVKVRFSVKAAGSRDVAVNYRSGQSFDVVVKDPDGAQIYKWSDGRFFTMALRDEKICPAGLTFEAEVPLPFGSKEGRYAVEAWLTATPSARASTSFSIVWTH